MILLRRVTLLGHLCHVEAEFCANMGGLVLRVQNNRTKLRAKLRISNCNCLVHRRVPCDVRCVVRQCAQRKGVLVGILTLFDEFEHEVAAAHIVHQVAELLIAEGIVAHVLDDCSAIRIGVRLPHLLVREPGIARQDHRPQLIVPQQIDNLFVCEHGICVRATAADEQHEGHEAADRRMQEVSSRKQAGAE